MFNCFKVLLILGFLCNVSLEIQAMQRIEKGFFSGRSLYPMSLRHFSARTSSIPPLPGVDHKIRYAGLSIDGAGMKGAVYIRVLQDIENRVQALLEEQDKPIAERTRLHEAFDFIGGTCVGAIITLSLTTPNSTSQKPHPLEWWEHKFRNNRDRVFPSTFLNTIKQWVWGVRYSSPEGYAQVLKESFGDVKLSDTLTDVVVTSIQFEDPKPFLFTREQARNDKNCDFFLKDMALASTVMFSQYPPMKIKSVTGKETPVVMDAFTSYNNSSQLVYNRLQKRTGAARDEILMVSIGGLEDINDTKTSTGLLWLLGKQISLFREAASSGARSEMQRLLGKKGFVRISPDPDLAKIKYNKTSKRVENILNNAAAEIIRYQSDQLQYAAETLAEIVRHKRQQTPKATTTQPTRDIESKNRYNILSIDGGGIRGVIPADVLHRIEEASGQPIFRLFDVIGGTSVGGLIACGLTAPHEKDPSKARYSAKEVAHFLEGEDRYKVFTPHWRGLGTYIRQIFSSAYISSPFEELLHLRFNDTLLSDALTNVVITATDHKSKNLVIFSKQGRETGVESALEGKYFVKDVVRATSAAPSYFIPGSIMEIRPTGPKRVDYIDGGICCNNPTQLAWNSLQIQHSDANYQNTLVLSLGTGQGPMSRWSPTENSSLTRWVFCGLANYFMRGHSYAVHDAMQDMFGENYMYIRPDLKKNIDLADVSQNNVDYLKGVVNEMVTQDQINMISYRVLKNKGLPIPEQLEKEMKHHETKI